MSTDHPGSDDGFLSRWSRVKTEAREASPTQAGDAAATPAGALPARSEGPAPELPPVEKLTLDSDFSGFFHPKVDEKLRRAALRKLFSDPHFNVMDGLDVYIDDYSKTEPIPAAMLASLKQAQRILEWAAQGKEDAQRQTSPELESPAEGASAIAPPGESQDAVEPAAAIEPAPDLVLRKT